MLCLPIYLYNGTIYHDAFIEMSHEHVDQLVVGSAFDFSIAQCGTQLKNVRKQDGDGDQTNVGTIWEKVGIKKYVWSLVGSQSGVPYNFRH